MPFKSRSQAKKFFADPKLRKYADEFAAKTNFKKLPNKVKKNGKEK